VNGDLNIWPISVF